MRLRIASRQSDLARIQAYRVAQAIQKIKPQYMIEFQFRESLGDRRLDWSLEKAPEKGLFTQDFYEDLILNKTDLVVHSWKDLPTENRPDTCIGATLPRADVRDLLLVKKSSVDKKEWRVLSSSPRRAYNLENSLVDYLPSRPHLRFFPLRGNIPSRLRKLLDSGFGSDSDSNNADALILAKAALDRLLEASEPEFAERQKEIREILKSLHWCVLPLSLSPGAAAQGAIAIEVLKSRKDLLDLLSEINCKDTFQTVVNEREVLTRWGGGCQQKIGISLLKRPFGIVQFLRGQTESGEILNHHSLRDQNFNPVKLPTEWQTEAGKMHPYPFPGEKWFRRQPININEGSRGSLPLEPQQKGVWVARAEAFPPSWEKIDFKVVWTAGMSTWKTLARRGIWVNGCAESLGEQENPRLESLTVEPITWIKLSHKEGYRSELGQSSIEPVATYQLIAEGALPDLRNKSHFFWLSGSRFLRAYEQFPQELLNGFHGCGPGNTYQILQKVLPSQRIRIFLSYDSWRELTLREKPSQITS